VVNPEDQMLMELMGQGGLDPSQSEGIPPEMDPGMDPGMMGMPPAPPMFESTDPASISEAVAALVAEMFGLDQELLPQMQQEALGAALPEIEALLAGFNAPPEPVPSGMVDREGAMDGGMPPRARF
jgi:hypothetical protein